MMMMFTDFPSNVITVPKFY